MLIQIAGLCYLANSFALILSPSIGSKLFPFILVPPFVAELSLALWMLVKGVDVTKWKARTGPAKVESTIAQQPLSLP